MRIESEAQFRARYPVVIEIPVAWGEMDGFGHVNNTVYFRYFESSRIAYFLATGFPTDAKQGDIGPILAETSCKFIRPVLFPDRVLAGSCTLNLEAGNINLEHGLWSLEQQRMVALGRGTLTPFDYKTQARAEIPAAWREAIEKLQPEFSA